MPSIKIEKLPSGVLILSLNKPKTGNALDAELFQDLVDCFAMADSDPEVRCVILAAEGKNFCSGADLAGFTTFINPEGTDPGRKGLNLMKNIQEWQEPFNAPEKCRKPVISVVQGFCVGGGVDLITSSDIRIATRDMKLAVKETALGLSADLGTLQRLPLVVADQGWARELVFTSKTVDAEECLRYGLFSRIYENKEEAMTEALKLAETIAGISPIAIIGSKLGLTYGRNQSIEKGLQHIALFNSIAVQSVDMTEGVQAAMKRRAPTFPKL